MTEAPEITAAIKVEFDLTPDTVIGHSYRQVSEEDYAADTPITLGDHVAQLIATSLAAQIKKELRESYNYRDIAQDAVAKYAQERIETALGKMTQPTDPYGTPKGQAKTIAELIDDKITAWFNAGRSGNYGDTNLEKLIAKAVDRQMQTDMNKAVEAAKKKILDTLTAEAQAQMAKAFASVVAAQVKA